MHWVKLNTIILFSLLLYYVGLLSFIGSSKPLVAISKASEEVQYKTYYDSLLYELNSTGDLKRARFFADQIELVNRKNRTPKGNMIELLATAQIEAVQSNYFNSNFHFYESLKIAQRVADPYFLSEIYRNLAVNHRQENQLPEAISFYKQAIGYSKQLNTPKKLALLNLNLGTAYYYSGDLDSAKYWFKNSFMIYDSLKNDQGRSYYFMSISDINIVQDSLQLAVSNLKKADVLSKEAPNSTKAQVKMALANCYAKLSAHKTAEKLSQQALELALPYKNKALLLSIYKLQLEIFDATNQLNRSNSILRKILFVEKELAEQDKELKLKSAKYGFDLNLQVEKNKLQEFEIEEQNKRNVLLIIGLLFFATFTTLLIYLYRQSNRKSKLIEKQAADLNTFNKTLELRIATRTKELASANTELILKNKEISTALLQGQQLERKRLANDLHDNLGGYITAMRWSFQALNTDKLDKGEQKIFEKINSMINEAYTSVRNLSHNLIPAELSEMGLAEALRKLIENLNENPKIVFIFSTKQAIQLDETIAFELYNITLELLTNILKHSTCNRVELIVEEVSNKIVISIIDNGVSYQFNADGFGQKSTMSRLKKLNGKLTYIHDDKDFENNLNYLKIEIPAIG